MAIMSSTRGKLIDLLNNHSNNFISGEKLSEALNISRSAVWKHMNELKKDGYTIEGVPRLGYRIIDTPDKISENTIKWGLDTTWLGKTIIHKETTETTQKDAQMAAREGKPHGTIVIANAQTNGKGRMGHLWHSTKDKGIWMSILLRPKLVPQQAPTLTLLAATVLADVLAKNISEKVTIKWPNDILIGSKKVAGILTEMQAEQDQIQYVVMGIGLNVNQSLQEMPPDIKQIATSFQIETNHLWDINVLIQDILRTFEKSYTTFMDNGFTPIKQKWESFGYQMGREIRIKTIQESYDAIFSGIDEDGALLVTHEGKTKKLYSAEIDWNINKDEHDKNQSDNEAR